MYLTNLQTAQVCSHLLMLVDSWRLGVSPVGVTAPQTKAKTQGRLTEYKQRLQAALLALKLRGLFPM
jgi:hypothetical protein